MALIKCKECGREISENANKCPNCGEPIKSKKKNYFLGLISFICSLITCYAFNSSVGVSFDFSVAGIISGIVSLVKKERLKAFPIIGILLSTFMLLGSIIIMLGMIQNTVTAEGVYKDALPSCSNIISLSEDNNSLVIDSNPLDIDDYYSSSTEDCIILVNEKFGFPDSLYEKMSKTRAIDGIQNDANDNFKVSWSYSPSHGLQIIYEHIK